MDPPSHVNAAQQRGGGWALGKAVTAVASVHAIVETDVRQTQAAVLWIAGAASMHQVLRNRRSGGVMRLMP